VEVRVVAKVKERPGTVSHAQDDALLLLLNDASRPQRDTRPPTDAQKREKRAVVLTMPVVKPVRKRRTKDESLAGYLSGLGRVPLLTGEGEWAIARTLREHELACWDRLLAVDGVRAWLRTQTVVALEPELRDDPALTSVALRAADDDRLLVDAALAAFPDPVTQKHRKKALDVRNQFVRANLRLVVSVAGRFHHHRMPMIDLIQEGNIGLIKSVHRFDPEKGFRFSTYAHWWIRQAIERAIMNKGSQVRMPVHVFDARREVHKATRCLQQSLGRDPTIEELIKETHMTPEKLHEVMAAVPREPQSLDDPMGDDEDRTLAESIGSTDPTPDQQVIQVEDARRVRRLLNRLSPMEVDILSRRFGLETDTDETLEEIGKSYRLSRERVRQIQVQGLKKLERLLPLRIDD
jgi:RNA polymerase sigma factor (sigma-70 family)